MKSIQLQQLAKSFGETEVIRGIDVTIEAGSSSHLSVRPAVGRVRCFG